MSDESKSQPFEIIEIMKARIPASKIDKNWGKPISESFEDMDLPSLEDIDKVVAELGWKSIKQPPAIIIKK